MSLLTLARKFILERGIHAGEPVVSIFSRGLVDKKGNLVRDADNLTTSFWKNGTVTKALGSAGTVVFSGLPSDNQIVTINDGVKAIIFEFDAGNFATGTLTLSGQPSDANTFTLSDGTTTKIFEFDSGVTGVASTGGAITFGGAPADGDIITLTTSTPAGSVATVYEFNNTGGVTAGHIAVLPGTTAATAATEFINAVNAASGYAGNGSTGYTASAGSAGVANLVRTATGAGNETITKSGTNITVTTSFSGGVTAVAAGLAITGGHVGVAIGGTTAVTCANLLAAIQTIVAFLFTASQGAGTTVTLTASARGTAANSFTLAKSGTNLAVSGSGNFTGGAAAGSGTVSGSNTAVAIAATGALTATNLYNAVNSASTFLVTATNGTAGTCTLVGSGLSGTAGNVAVTSNATNVVVTGMTGGTNNNAAIILAADSIIPSGRTVKVTGFNLKVNGSTAWNDAATVTIQDTAGNIFATIAKSALTGNAIISPHTSGVTLGAAWFAAGAASKGLEVLLSGNEATGSDLLFQINGQIS